MPAKDHSRPPFDGQQTAFSSPPCYAHELDPAYLGLVPAIDMATLHTLKSTLDAVITAIRSLRFP